MASIQFYMALVCSIQSTNNTGGGGGGGGEEGVIYSSDVKMSFYFNDKPVLDRPKKHCDECGGSSGIKCGKECVSCQQASR